MIKIYKTNETNMIERIEPFVNSVNLYYNSLSKDYGVTEKEIKLYEVRV